MDGARGMGGGSGGLPPPTIGARGLYERSAKWRAALRDAACGPLIVAQEIIDLGAEWTDEVATALGHRTYTSWLKETLGEHEDYYRRRARAVEVIGEHARRMYHHEAAVYLAGIADDERRSQLDSACRAEWARRRAAPVPFVTGAARDSAPLTLRQVQVVRERIWDEPKERKPAARCEACVIALGEADRLRALLRQHGIKV